MPTIDAHYGIDMESLDELAYIFQDGEAVTQTSTSYVIRYDSPQGWYEKIAFTGTGFGTYINGFPTTGTITAFSYFDDEEVASFTVTGLNVQVAELAPYIMSDNIEGLFEYLLSGNDTLLGASYPGYDVDVLLGEGGNDVIIGYAGADTLRGGAGNDYLLDNNDLDYTQDDHAIDHLYGEGGDDRIDVGRNDIADGGDGFDRLTVYDVSASAGVNLNFSNVADIQAYLHTLYGGTYTNFETFGFAGTNFNDVIVGTNNIDGMGLSSTMEGFDGDDRLSGLGGQDLMFGGNGNDILSGGEGNDYLEGNAGNDSLDGGVGVDRMLGGTGDDTYGVENVGDIVTELANQGTDTVKTNLDGYVLGANVENLTLTGSGNISGTGNDLNNVMIGNGGNNTLNSGKGDDQLYGGAGDDILNSGTGADRMYGGAGNDIYYYGVGDTIIEAADAGIDTVYASVNFTIGSTLENLVLIGDRAINGTGNNLGNRMQGNDQANVLQGGRGNDALYGQGGDDILIGGRDADTLGGGAGADTFRFDVMTDSLVAGADTIIDYSAADGDRLDLSRIDADTTTDGDQAFHQVRAFTGHGGEMMFSYNPDLNRTTLSLDINGDGNADMAIVILGQVSSTEGWLL